MENKLTQRFGSRTLF